MVAARSGLGHAAVSGVVVGVRGGKSVRSQAGERSEPIIFCACAPARAHASGRTHGACPLFIDVFGD